MRIIKRVLSLAALLCLTAQSTALALPGETLGDKVSGGGGAPVSERGGAAYYHYRADVTEKGIPYYTGGDMLLPAGESGASTSSVNGKDNVILWTKDNGALEWVVEIPEDALYALRFSYCAIETGGDITREILIDGKSPFKEAENIVLPRRFQDAGKVQVNSLGDEIRPRQEEQFVWQTALAQDNQGLYHDPLLFYLTKGRHTIGAKYLGETSGLEYMALVKPEQVPSYADKAREYADKAYASASKSMYFEAESTGHYKTKTTVGMISDGDPTVSPSSLGYTKMNAVGGSNWSGGNDSITWRFEVKESGLYKLNLRVLQSWGDGLAMYRQIKIDDHVPFEELKEYKFNYDSKWRSEILSDGEGNPYLLYLEAGPHTLTLENKLGDRYNAEMLRLLTDDAEILSDAILKIRMIIGVNPDTVYDYELMENIPELKGYFEQLIAHAKTCQQISQTIGVKKQPALCNQFKMVASQLQAMLDDPYTIPKKMDELTGILSNYGSWLQGLTDQPLAVDFIEFLPADGAPTDGKANFFDYLKVTVVNFLYSFAKDYDSVGGTWQGEEKASIDVWIGRGKDWGKVIKQLADEEFTPATGTRVNINVLPAGQLNSGSGVNSLLLAVSSGVAPDVAMGVAAASPGEFAIRNALVDLKSFPDYEEAASRFSEQMMVPFTYRGGVYALPETVTFKALFYRKDIVEDIGVAIPNTWDEVYNAVLPVLSQNNMQFYVQSSTAVTAINPLYELFLYQNGGTFYKDNNSLSALDSKEAYQAFKEYCDLFTVRGVPTNADFFNRMRTGEIPMGIADFSYYMTLSVAAPELLGRWAIAPIPGHMGEDGAIDRTVGSSVTESVMIMAQSGYPKESWEFLKWWMEAETQTKFGLEIESAMGKGARWPSANQEAFRHMPWDDETLRVINGSFENIREVPVVVGGYFTSRHVGNGWNRVVVSHMQNARDSLEKTVKDINKELKRRQEQYGVG